MRNWLIWASAVTILLAAFCGCAKKVAVKPSQESVKATAALGAFQQMERAFVARDSKGVMSFVSEDMKNGYPEFETNLRKDLETYDRVSLEYEVDRVEEDGDKVSLVLHWFGKWWDKTGKEQEARGNSIFTFKVTGPAATLTEVIGDSPFGMVR